MPFTIPGLGGQPDPRKFSPIPTGPQSPVSSGALPVAGGGFSSQQQSMIQNALSAAGIWDFVKDHGGDAVWDFAKQFLPKDAQGGIDWGKLAGGVIDAAAAVNAFQRGQQSDKYAKQGEVYAKEEWDRKAPLRVAGQEGMLNPHAHATDSSAIRAKANVAPLQVAPPSAPGNTNMQNAQRLASSGGGNPFAKPLPMPLPVAPSPTPPMPGAPPTGPRPSPATPTPLPLPLAPQAPQQRPLAGLGRKIAPLPVAGDPRNDDPLNPTFAGSPY